MKIVIDTEKLQTTPYYAKNCVVTMEDIIKCGIPLKKGHWIYPNIPPQYIDGQKCSECGYNQYGGKTNYCPHCGADMRGDEDEKIQE